MAFFDDFSKKAKKFADVASEKAKEAADSAKTTAAILSEQRDLDKSYKAIGEWFVAEFQGDIPAEVKDLVDSINAAKLRIAELQAQPEEEIEVEIIVEEPAKKYCAGCGEEVSGKFCSNCGAAQE